MKIIRLTAENVKRIRAVEITPDGNMVVISGRNGQGKTSVLDSIWLALAGGTAQKETAKPIRDGEETARVRLDLGDIIVTRRWDENGTTLRVTTADGAAYQSPQKMLDGLIGSLSFDPLGFTQAAPREQMRSLMELVKLDFDPEVMAQDRAQLFDLRTTTNREHKTLLAQIDGLPTPSADLPAEEISAAKIMAEQRAALELIENNRRLQAAAETATEALARHRERVASLRMQLDQAESGCFAAQVNADVTTAEAAGLPPEPNLDEFNSRMQEVESTNRQIRNAVQRRALVEQAESRADHSVRLTSKIAALDEHKAKAIADAKMPIPGLAFDDAGVTYNGVPFKQCSAAEQLRVSVAMAMAMNPKIRVIRITDGSLLDSENMRVIEEMAADNDVQVWIERVEESGGVGVYIEDGSISGKGAAPAPAADLVPASAQPELL